MIAGSSPAGVTMDNKITLSRRNLETLPSKLNRTRSGDSSLCTLVKCVNKDKMDEPPEYVTVTAVENDNHYMVHRPGPVADADYGNLNNIGENF